MSSAKAKLAFVRSCRQCGCTVAPGETPGAYTCPECGELTREGWSVGVVTIPEGEPVKDLGHMIHICTKEDDQ